MNLDSLAGMFSQRSGVQQSMSSNIMSTIMNYMMQNFMQKGLGSFMNSGGGDRNSMQSSFSELEGGINNDPRHPLVQQVKNNCGLQDDNQARMYTQQATGFLSEHANNDPQGLSSLFGSLGGGGGRDTGLGGLGLGQQQQGGGGGIGDMVGGLLGGGGSSSGDNQNPSQQQQQKKKGGGLGDMLGL
ncbi:MAG: hypothetical protein ACJ70O_08245 [Nitrososphaera sp.]